MNSCSQGWKVSLFAIAAVVALSACGEKKKPKAASPYSGVWINQKNIQDYSAHSGELAGGNYERFCPKVYKASSRFGDSEYRVRALSVHGNGEVFRYSISSVTTLGYRESNFIGTVRPDGSFAPGSIGPDGRVVPVYQQGFGLPGQEMSAQATFIVNPQQPEVMRMVSSNGQYSMMRKVNLVVAKQYAEHVMICLAELKQYNDSRPVAPVGPGKDYDPQVDRRERRERDNRRDRDYSQDDLDEDGPIRPMPPR